MPRSHDAIIIGSGVIGCSIATELARRGHRTLNLDKLSLAGSGSTSYSSGICRMMYSVADSVKFAWEGYTYYDRWAEHIGTQPEGGLAQFRRCGGLVLRSEASETFLGRVMAAHDSVGLPYEEWSREELRRRGLDDRSFFPPRRIDDEQFGDAGAPLDGAVFFPKCGYVSSPDLAARNLQSAAMATGLSEFRFGAPVSAILRKGGAVSGVALADGTTLEAPVVINAAGPHSSSITALAFPDAHENDMGTSTPLPSPASPPPPPVSPFLVRSDGDAVSSCAPRSADDAADAPGGGLRTAATGGGLVHGHRGRHDRDRSRHGRLHASRGRARREAPHRLDRARMRRAVWPPQSSHSARPPPQHPCTLLTVACAWCGRIGTTAIPATRSPSTLDERTQRSPSSGPTRSTARRCACPRCLCRRRAPRRASQPATTSAAANQPRSNGAGRLENGQLCASLGRLTASRVACSFLWQVTADWTPIYDKSALPGYFMAIGTSGNQFKNAGVAGRLMADIIEATQNGADLDAAPLDFKLLRIPGQHSISSATFSRRRQHLATSGTVLG
jgi:glycine/D-amino acid oxidase-like deaminating enzyme